MLRLIALAGLAMMVAASPAAVAQEATFYTVTYVETGPVLTTVIVIVTVAVEQSLSMSHTL